MQKEILVIDDDNSTRLLLGFLLKQHYQVVTKKDGMEAMLWLNDGNLPDLILLDMSMPRLSGYSFLQNLRKSGFFKDIPVIIVSATDRLNEIEYFLQNKHNDFLHKPFNPQNLFSKIEKALQPMLY